MLGYYPLLPNDFKVITRVFCIVREKSERFINKCVLCVFSSTFHCNVKGIPDWYQLLCLDSLVLVSYINLGV